MLAEALGYEGRLRHVAFHRSPQGDVLRWADGEATGEGVLAAWFAFVGHPNVLPSLLPYDFGSGERPAVHWLLIDREERTVSAGRADEIGRFLAATLPEEVRQLRAERALTLQDEQLAKARRRALRDAAFLDRLQRWLDTQG